jgi:hypothetical protein
MGISIHGYADILPNFRLGFLPPLCIIAAAPKKELAMKYSAKISAIIAMGILLNGAPLAQGQQGRSAVTTLTVHVIPEELLRIDTKGSVSLKIRLARASAARLWAADICASPPPEAIVIAKSGTYNIPGFTTIGVGYVCLQSSDGALNDAVPIAAGTKTQSDP